MKITTKFPWRSHGLYERSHGLYVGGAMAYMGGAMAYMVLKTTIVLALVQKLGLRPSWTINFRVLQAPPRPLEVIDNEKILFCLKQYAYNGWK